MNYYEILGVNKNSSQKQIRESYKNLVKKYHPDLYKGDKSFAEKKTKEINVAYDTLSNPQKRAEYDEEISPKTTYTSTYSNPNYTSSTTTQKYDDFKRKYNNYNYNTRTYKDGSEHDYSTYANYENINKSYNYKNSNYASSNYTNRKTSQNEFYDKIFNKFESASFKTKKRIIIFFLIVYIFFVIITMRDFIYIFNFKGNSNNNLNEKSNNVLNTTIVNNSSENTLSNKSVNKSSTNTQTIYIPNSNSINNDINNENNNTTTDYPSNNKNFNINDIYSEEDLKSIYEAYFEGTDTFENYDEFKDTFEYYIQNYMYPF